MLRDQDVTDRTRVERVDPLIGSVLHRRFRIDFRLAAGGFGSIYQATHLRSGHRVALKILHPQLASHAGVVARFRREGATLTTLRSPHTVAAYELGEADDGTLYIVMELLHGESLYERFRARGPLAWRDMARIARQVCDSLEEAHALGIVHRDLTPTNLHLEPADGGADHVKVLDFGIAKILREGELDASDLTKAGQMIGTLDYMSPEQIGGGSVTGQSDQYTLGVVVYEMIAGARPFPEAPNAVVALASIVRSTPPLLSSRVPVPAALDRIVARCLEREPARRYREVTELAADLDALLAAPDPDDVTRTIAVTLPSAQHLTPTPLVAPPQSRAAPPPLPPAPASRVAPVAPGTPIEPVLSIEPVMPPAPVMPSAPVMPGMSIVPTARDAAIRRVVWIAVLVLGAIVGIVSAMI